jgi:hypothetical protein
MGLFGLTDLTNTIHCVSPADLASLTPRMMGITGFVSNLCPPGDNRPRVFCRYYHVRRVAWAADLLLRLSRDGHRFDADLLRWYAWAHDLNRWPFAHNSERGIFNQAADLPDYFAEAAIAVPEQTMRELQGIVNKDYRLLGPEARLVLLADMITGFVEDPLWLITTINVTPEVIPRKVADYLGLQFDDTNFLQGLVQIAGAFHPGLAVEQFLLLFDTMFTKIMTQLIQNRNLADPTTGISEDFQKMRFYIKEHFLRCVVYRYNNDYVSQGTALKHKVMLPLVEQLGVTANRHLTRITDEECIAEAIDRSIIPEHDRHLFYPRLDYVTSKEPERSFRFFLAGKAVKLPRT